MDENSDKRINDGKEIESDEIVQPKLNKRKSRSKVAKLKQNKNEENLDTLIDKASKDSSNKKKESKLINKSSDNSDDKKNKKKEWNQFFCYLNDKEREKLMQLENFHSPTRKKKTKGKKMRSKTAQPKSISDSKQNLESQDNAERKGSLESSTKSSVKIGQQNEKILFKSEKNQKSKTELSREKVNKSAGAEKNLINSKYSESYPSKLDRLPLKSNPKLDNMGSEYSNEFEDAMNSLQTKATYKNLMRSLKADL
jgi:hypothetical protein